MKKPHQSRDSILLCVYVFEQPLALLSPDDVRPMQQPAVSDSGHVLPYEPQAVVVHGQLQDFVILLLNVHRGVRVRSLHVGIMWPITAKDVWKRKEI